MSKPKLIALIVGIATLVALGAGWIRGDGTPTQTFTIERKNFVQTIAARGHVDTLHYVPLRAPDSPFSLQVVFLVPAGKPIIGGEVVAQFDGREVEKQIEKLEEELSVYEATILEKKEEWANRYERLDNMIMKLSEESKMTEISLANIQFDSKLKQNEAQVWHNGVLRTLKTMRHYHDRFGFWKSGEVDRWVEIADGCRTRIAEHRELLKTYVIYAPFDTLARYPRVRIKKVRRQVEPGDNLSRMLEFGKLPDYSSKCMEIFVAEKQLELIEIGMSIEFQAISQTDVTIRGTVTSKSSVASQNHSRPGQPLYLIRADIAPSHVDDPDLIVGANVQAKIIVNTHRNVFPLPRDLIDRHDTEVAIYNAQGTPIVFHASTAAVVSGYYLLPAGKDKALTVTIRDKEQG